MDITKSNLMLFLKRNNTVYYGKVIELRRSITEWLNYIPHTFPHYTRHTIQHSDNIVIQLSHLLFKSNNKPTATFSSTEIYILVACAYLHDAGMVVSNDEMSAILSTSEWNEWTTNNGSGANRWKEIMEFRNSNHDVSGYRDFIADVQTRYLIAEFFRRSHHIRSASVIIQHQSTLGRFAFDDPQMLNTISDVCISHGLRQHELDDYEKFPDRRDIQGEKVNVKFLAILLRIGDLLDMSSDRACPLLLNAACPLPPDSLAHWTQYQRITHQLTSPDKIEITADCETQEEHRFLQDWCQWLVDEINEAQIKMAHCSRHNNWMPPNANFNTEIKIRPSKTAMYFPSNLEFKLDKEAIYNILINDAYSEPFSFIRELLQNSIDATRCKLFNDLTKDGKEFPKYPTLVDMSIREKYPIEIHFEDRVVKNSLSGEEDVRQLFIINDYGIGMDQDIIEKYFLQVGRSYYKSNDFKRNYRFTPTSKFGIGFLSVFSVSDNVTIETLKHIPNKNDSPIRLKLSGPTNCLLTEHGERKQSGTKIEVMFRKSTSVTDIIYAISNWCRRVEFPIIIQNKIDKHVIRAESEVDFTYELLDQSEDNSKFIMRSFPIDREGLEGDLYVFTRNSKAGESWCDRHWAENDYLKKCPGAELPKFLNSITCLHGIQINYRFNISSRHMMYRLDIRSNIDHTISRDNISKSFSSLNSDLDAKIINRWIEILSDHLSNSKLANNCSNWKYKQRLANNYPIKSFWSNIDGLFPLYSKSTMSYTSLNYIQSLPVINTITSNVEIDRIFHNSRSYDRFTEGEFSKFKFTNHTIRSIDFSYFSDDFRKSIFKGRKPIKAKVVNKYFLVIEWKTIDDASSHYILRRKPIVSTTFKNNSFIGLLIHTTIDSSYNCVLLNSNNNYVKWLFKTIEYFKNNTSDISLNIVENLLDLTYDAVAYYNTKSSNLSDYMQNICKLPIFKTKLKPPMIDFKDAIGFDFIDKA